MGTCVVVGRLCVFCLIHMIINPLVSDKVELATSNRNCCFVDWYLKQIMCLCRAKWWKKLQKKSFCILFPSFLVFIVQKQ
ncbi:hypothetical protein Hdeb2414_s0021g00573491 [Helianthus debilis subsp. tardiflorus]